MLFKGHVLSKRNFGLYVRESKYRHTPQTNSRSSMCHFLPPIFATTASRFDISQRPNGRISNMLQMRIGSGKRFRK